MTSTTHQGRVFQVYSFWGYLLIHSGGPWTLTSKTHGKPLSPSSLPLRMGKWPGWGYSPPRLYWDNNCLQPMEKQQQSQLMYASPLRGDGCPFTISIITEFANTSIGMKKVFNECDGGCQPLPWPDKLISLPGDYFGLCFTTVSLFPFFMDPWRWSLPFKCWGWIAHWIILGQWPLAVSQMPAEMCAFPSHVQGQRLPYPLAEFCKHSIQRIV